MADDRNTTTPATLYRERLQGLLSQVIASAAGEAGPTPGGSSTGVTHDTAVDLFVELANQMQRMGMEHDAVASAPVAGSWPWAR